MAAMSAPSPLCAALLGSVSCRSILHPCSSSSSPSSRPRRRDCRATCAFRRHDVSGTPSSQPTRHLHDRTCTRPDSVPKLENPRKSPVAAHFSALASDVAAAPVAEPTYSPNGLWGEGEVERLSSMQRGSPPGSLLLTRGEWEWRVQDLLQYQLCGRMTFHNTSDRNEIFVADVEGSAVLLGSEDPSGSISCRVKVASRHPCNSPPPREDGYWRAYITRARETTGIEVTVDIVSCGKPLRTLQAVRVDVAYVSYGPHGRLPLTQHVILPLQFPPAPAAAPILAPTAAPATVPTAAPAAAPTAAPSPWREVSPGLSVLPVPTHLLCHLDSPLEVLRRYALPLMQPGDTVAIGESPLAIMQGRFKHPQNMRPGLVAKLCCKPFHPTSSLATACGMQALVDLVGRARVILAVILAAVARLLGQRGWFYRLAGEQSRLIDDVTGTLPPYDQFITLGPLRPQETADALREKAGVEVAIVDVNDLRRVDILGASSGVNSDLLTQALSSNPAGNSDEQTPLVIIRGCSLS